ncbi:MAG: SHOCT domain-containing protein [Acidimicrobiia bacterium]
MNWDSIWDVIWFFLVIFLWVAFFMVLFMVIGDLFRDRSMGGAGKAVWAIVLIFLPFLGTFIYLIARGSGMSDRAVAAAQHDQELAQQYAQSVVATSGWNAADQIERAKSLLDSGAITQDEFNALKAKALG